MKKRGRKLFTWPKQIEWRSAMYDLGRRQLRTASALAWLQGIQAALVLLVLVGIIILAVRG